MKSFIPTLLALMLTITAGPTLASESTVDPVGPWKIEGGPYNQRYSFELQISRDESGTLVGEILDEDWKEADYLITETTVDNDGGRLVWKIRHRQDCETRTLEMYLWLKDEDKLYGKSKGEKSRCRYGTYKEDITATRLPDQ